MTNEDERHTLSHLQGKGHDRKAWDVDLDLIDDWLRAVDDGTYDQVVAALKILTELGPGLGRPAGRLDHRFATQEHEGTPTGLVWTERGTDLVRLRSQAQGDPVAGRRQARRLGEVVPQEHPRS